MQRLIFTLALWTSSPDAPDTQSEWRHFIISTSLIHLHFEIWHVRLTSEVQSNKKHLIKERLNIFAMTGTVV